MRACVLLSLAGCASSLVVQERLERAEGLVEAAQRAYGVLCSPEYLANAQAHLDFTRVELSQGNLVRADAHLDRALAYGEVALAESTPCGVSDRDRDFVADIVDRCPDVPEDPNGVQDRDGCPEAPPADVPSSALQGDAGPEGLLGGSEEPEDDWLLEPAVAAPGPEAASTAEEPSAVPPQAEEPPAEKIIIEAAPPPPEPDPESEPVP